MFYLVEKHALQVATAKNLERFVDLASNQIMPVYEQRDVKLMASWLCSADTLLQITHIFELASFESAAGIYRALNTDSSLQDTVGMQNSLISETDWQLYQSGGRIFTDAFHKAIEAGRSAPLKSYTIATLKMSRNKIPLLLPKQEAAIKNGMPLVAFMKSVTGRHDQVIDIWKGDLQEAGYQTQAYYDSIGMSEEWWNWIRDIAPEEKMVKVSMLPYSPLQ